MSNDGSKIAAGGLFKLKFVVDFWRSNALFHEKYKFQNLISFGDWVPQLLLETRGGI